MEVVTRIVIPPAGAFFEGHFPGKPILPGVAQIALMQEALAPEIEEVMSPAGIAFVRLRQLVMPADVLELSAATIDNHRLRFNLKRDNTLVTNGELLLGPMGAANNTPVNAPNQLPVIESTMPPIDALLPHRAPMQFIQSIVQETAQSMVCMARIPVACPLAKGDSAPAVLAIETAAQAAAAWEALQRARQADTAASARIGYLVAMREVSFFTNQIPTDVELQVVVELEDSAPPLSHYRIALFLDGELLVQGGIATFLTEEQA